MRNSTPRKRPPRIDKLRISNDLSRWKSLGSPVCLAGLILYGTLDVRQQADWGTLVGSLPPLPALGSHARDCGKISEPQVGSASRYRDPSHLGPVARNPV